MLLEFGVASKVSTLEYVTWSIEPSHFKGFHGWRSLWAKLIEIDRLLLEQSVTERRQRRELEEETICGLDIPSLDQRILVQRSKNSYNLPSKTRTLRYAFKKSWIHLKLTKPQYPDPSRSLPQSFSPTTEDRGRSPVRQWRGV